MHVSWQSDRMAGNKLVFEPCDYKKASKPVWLARPRCLIPLCSSATQSAAAGEQRGKFSEHASMQRFLHSYLNSYMYPYIHIYISTHTYTNLCVCLCRLSTYVPTYLPAMCVPIYISVCALIFVPIAINMCLQTYRFMYLHTHLPSTLVHL